MDISFSNEFPCINSAPTAPRTLGDIIDSSYLDDSEFEFETSRRFNLSDFDIDTDDQIQNPFDEQKQQRVQRQRGDSLPAMAFADELFCDGKVLPLVPPPPLKLPPRLHNRDGNNTSTTPSSTGSSSPRSPGSAFRLPFLRPSLWNDDFDPFMVALEMVKEEEMRGKSKGTHGVRRTRSLSPFRGKSPKRPSDPLKQRSRSPNTTLSEPKKNKVPKVAVETSKEERERGRGWTKKRKREKIMKLLFGNGHMKLSLKSGVPTQSTQRDKDERMSEKNEMTLACHKPRLFLCLGF